MDRLKELWNQVHTKCHELAEISKALNYKEQELIELMSQIEVAKLEGGKVNV
jgi:hypothetical protein